MNVAIKKLHKKAELPVYQTSGSAGMDIHACLDASIILAPMERRMIPTGLAIAVPEGFEAQVRSRSGLSLKHGITVVNGVGTIDADYRGEVGVLLINLSDSDYEIKHGDRIAQMVVASCEQAAWQEVDELKQTLRGRGGFGSTDTQHT